MHSLTNYISSISSQLSIIVVDYLYQDCIQPANLLQTLSNILVNAPLYKEGENDTRAGVVELVLEDGRVRDVY